MRKSGKPAWWKVDLVVPVTIGLLVLLQRLGLAAPWRQIAQVIVVGVSFGWMSVWTWLNASAIEQEGAERAYQERVRQAEAEAGLAAPLTLRQAHYRQVMRHTADPHPAEATAAQEGGQV
ncbi:MAG: hypothetical protein KIT87_05800 [Anaerolineae bacterium]|nr:hypothetical protein [Anaerolineae bacterium]